MTSMIRSIYIMSLLLVSVQLSADTLKPFTSDGCSAFPDGTLKQNTLWLSCCSAHDYEYWKGGTYDQRLQADRDLRQCVVKNGEPEIGFLMLAGVRIGGTPYLPTSFRWGYGWPYPRDYGVLTTDELEQIKRMTALIKKPLK